MRRYSATTTMAAISAWIVSMFSLGACVGHVHLLENVGRAQAVPPDSVSLLSTATTQPVANVAASMADANQTLITMLLTNGEVLGGVGATAGILAIWALRRFVAGRAKK